jgi:Uma2 family endonuclease
MLSEIRRAVSIEAFMAHRTGWVEVVDGQLVEMEEAQMAASYYHVIIIDNLFRTFDPFVHTHDLGRVHTDGLSYILHEDEAGLQVVRIPDFSFIRRVRLPAPTDYGRPFRGHPDLAVEVVSPTEKPDALMRKISDYLRYGTEQVWALYPERSAVHVYRFDDNAPAIYRLGESFMADTLFPGLHIQVKDIFADIM